MGEEEEEEGEERKCGDVIKSSKKMRRVRTRRVMIEMLRLWHTIRAADSFSRDATERERSMRLLMREADEEQRGGSRDCSRKWARL